VPALVSQLAEVLAGIESEVIFVDDSDDETPKTIEAASGDRALVAKVIRRTGPERRGGLSTAVVEGIVSATGKYVLIMDADLQHPTGMIPQLLATAYKADADIVIASRNIPGGSDAGLAGPGRRVVSWGAKGLVKLLFFRTLRGVTDPLSGFFLARREVLAEGALRPIGFKILLDILVRCDHPRVEEVPLPFAPRAAGKSKATIRQGVDFLAHVVTLFWDVRRDGELRKRRGLRANSR
jgi:dolichol-phosphate mannosyltransferase